ncbi:DUF3945 domain-containing protein (plasmid) [Spirosoma sp. SC4-14]|uniref:DUF3945 domain-containing protein n=1 Tax=Spirosoma sp. SC4-14 TaxID=3128900 RepID=UPI0030CE29DA
MAKQKFPKKSPSLKITPVAEVAPEAEQLKEQFYELLLPEEYEELRQYLGNDGFLSNDEITTALRDARLEKDELSEKLSALQLPNKDETLREKLTDYLWELHQIIQDPALEKIRADRYYQVETVQPIPDAERTTAEVDQETRQRKADRSLEIVNGGLIANFLHNFKKAYKLEEPPHIEMGKKTRYQWQDVGASLEKMGITREIMVETGNLDRLLKGEKTGLIDFKSEYNGQETLLRGKIYLVKHGEEVIPYFQTVKQTLQVPDQKWGYSFSQDDKETLKQKGELGKLVELEELKTKQKFKAYIGVDQETNSLTAWRADRVYIPMQIKGVTLSKEQQETLQQGGAIRLTGLTSENGQKYEADIQLSAGKRSLSFTPPSAVIKQTLDQKTAKDLDRASNELQGTSVGNSTTKNKLPEQKQKKAEAKQKGIDPELSKANGQAVKKEATKKQGKKAKAQKDQSHSLA